MATAISVVLSGAGFARDLSAVSGSGTRLYDDAFADFATMADSLKPARLQYACSAHYMDHIDGIYLTEAQQTFLKEIIDPLFRESVRGFMVTSSSGETTG